MLPEDKVQRDYKFTAHEEEDVDKEIEDLQKAIINVSLFTISFLETKNRRDFTFLRL